MRPNKLTHWLTLCVLLFIQDVPAATLELTPGEQQWLANNKHEILFTGDPNWLPFEAFTAEGEYIGIVSAFLKKFTQDTGIPIRFQVTSSWSETLRLAGSKEVDVLSDVLGSLTLHDNYEFTDSYLSNNLVVLSDTVGSQIDDVTDIAASPIGIIKGYGYTWELYERYPDAHFIEVDNIQEGLNALETGRLHYLITTYALGQFQLTTLHKDQIKIRGQLPIEARLAFAVRKDWPQLTDIFNRWIATLSPEERYQIAETWYLENTQFFIQEKTNWTYLIVSSLVMVMLLTVVVFAWRSRALINRQKQHYKAALAAINAVEWRLPKHATEFDLPTEFLQIVPSGVAQPSNLNAFIELVHPSHQEFVYEAFRQARLDSTKAIDVEFKLNTEETCWLAIKGSTQEVSRKYPVLIGTLENITENKQAEAEKQQSDSFVALLFDVIPDIVVLHRFDQHEPIANRAYRTLFKQRSLVDCLPNEQLKIWQRQEKALLETQSLSHTSTWVEISPEHRAYFSIIRIPFLDQEQQVNGILSVARDITDNFLLQQELQQAKHQADQANASKSVFLANMSHEIRTPLNAILGYAQLLQQSTLEEEASHQVQRIYYAGQRLLSLINDILDLSKIEAGKLQLNPEKFPLKQELSELIALHKQKASAKGLAFKTDIQIHDQDHVILDKTKFGQILSNALDNAVKFTPAGHIHLSVEYRQKHLKIQIQDTGPGITQEELDRLFQPFTQGHSGNLNGGTGLGLVLSRRLCDAMGGSFSLSSQLGQGTHVQIDVPAVLSSEDHSSMKPVQWRLPQGAHKTALIIEDDELSRDMLQHMLVRMGFTTLVAEDGEVALDYLNQKLDVVFSDIRMPKMDGVTLIQHIRHQPALLDLPVIAVTASSFDHEKRFYLENGFTDFIAKPIPWHTLCQSLQAIMPLEEYELQSSKPASSAAENHETAYITMDMKQHDAIIGVFKQACLVGDVDEALVALKKLQELGLPSDKLDIIKNCLIHYDFDGALSITL